MGERNVQRVALALGLASVGAGLFLPKIAAGLGVLLGLAAFGYFIFPSTEGAPKGAKSDWKTIVLVCVIFVVILTGIGVSLYAAIDANSILNDMADEVSSWSDSSGSDYDSMEPEPYKEYDPCDNPALADLEACQ